MVTTGVQVAEPPTNTPAVAPPVIPVAVPHPATLKAVPAAMSFNEFTTPGVVPPIVPGTAKVAPLSEDAFRLGTLVVLAITKGAVPVACVLVIWPEADIVVAATVPGVVAPIDVGFIADPFAKTDGPDPVSSLRIEAN